MGNNIKRGEHYSLYEEMKQMGREHWGGGDPL